MIEGLKVTVKGGELRDLCDQRSKHHDERATVYEKQIADMNANAIEGMQYTNGDPVKALQERRTQHLSEAREMHFIATHIDPTESYLLDRDALHRLGITANRY
jgi:hypothetical protein